MGKPAPAGVRVVYVRLSDIERWPRNPKDHDIPTIKASLQRFGFVAPLIRDDGTGRLVAGHGRQEALSALKNEGASPPPRVQVAEDGEWLVPVLSGVAFADEAEAEAYLLVDNRATEIGGWDEDALGAILSELAPLGLTDGLGWTAEEITAYTSVDVPEPVQLPELPSAKTPIDKLEGYMSSGIRQAVLHYTRDEYEEFVRLCDALRASTNADNNATLILAVLRSHATDSR